MILLTFKFPVRKDGINEDFLIESNLVVGSIFIVLGLFTARNSCCSLTLTSSLFVVQFFDTSLSLMNKLFCFSNCDNLRASKDFLLGDKFSVDSFFGIFNFDLSDVGLLFAPDPAPAFSNV